MCNNLEKMCATTTVKSPRKKNQKRFLSSRTPLRARQTKSMTRSTFISKVSERCIVSHSKPWGLPTIVLASVISKPLEPLQHFQVPHFLARQRKHFTIATIRSEQRKHFQLQLAPTHLDSPNFEETQLQHAINDVQGGCQFTPSISYFQWRFCGSFDFHSWWLPPYKIQNKSSPQAIATMYHQAFLPPGQFPSFYPGSISSGWTAAAASSK